MRWRKYVDFAQTLVVLTGLVISLVQPLGSGALQAAPSNPSSPIRRLSGPQGSSPGETGLYRARVSFRTTLERQKLTKLGVKVLQEGKDWAQVVADDSQLETLARQRFEPSGTNELASLVSANSAAKPWLASSVSGLLNTAAEAQRARSQGSSAASVATTSARQMVQALSAAQQAGISSLSSVDDDGDGLTNTEESWWCTDPENADSNGNGVPDGVEVQQALDWMANRRAGPPALGPPFKGWPMDPNGGNFIPTCVDRDQDSVPDAAERWVLGLNPNAESTAHDMFDDGQKLFGFTKWGWGALPRVEDTNYITAQMPSWVKAPGNHPMVAAFPAPQIDIVPSSLVVDTVTTITTDHVIGSGTERQYSTSQTKGVSISVADTVTWNDWQEVSNSLTQHVAASAAQGRLDPIDAAVTAAVNWGKAGWNAVAGVAEAVGISGSCILLGAETAGFACAAAIIGGAPSLVERGQNVWDAFHEPDVDQTVNKPNRISTAEDSLQGTGSVQKGANPVTTQDYDTSNRAPAPQGTRYQYDSTGALMAQNLYQISQVLAAPTRTTTQTSGHSTGGAKTMTTAQYEDNTVTNGQAFSNQESWSNATADNTAHSADLWFSYKVTNAGTEYARQIGNLAFNIYLGDDTNPIYTYFVAPDLGGDGMLHNFMPGQSATFSSRAGGHAIPLTLDQLKQLDSISPPGNIRIAVADYSYGVDQLFHQDALNAGVMLSIDDGNDDGDSTIDNYLIPTWGDTDTIQDIVGRYFPNQLDADGNILAIWTPEYRSDSPSWCLERQAMGSAIWCKHAFTSADWWNIYLSNMGDGTAQLKDTPAHAGSSALIRFNRDSDGDGYSDSFERQMGTDPFDPTSRPQSGLVAGLNSIRAANAVTATISLLNTGNYDAYGVEAVMVAPDDSISIVDNTVGGSGRVGARKQVIVGSKIAVQQPLPSQWTQTGHASPATSGYYTDIVQNRNYTFTVQCANPGGCSVGAGSWNLNWSDGIGATGSLNFGLGYHSPTPLAVGTAGVNLAFVSGNVLNGESFVVQAHRPGDTFSYTINREPYAAPIVIVSYNDPQGNHRFATPVNLAQPTDNLAQYGGQMQASPGIQIVTSVPVQTGANTTNILVNNPTDKLLSNSHVYLDFITMSSTFASKVSVTTDLAPGPNVVPVQWNTSSFNPTYDSTQDYVALAFLTDYQGNILDTYGRMLSNFQADPKATASMASADQLWDFGTAQQGTLLQRSFTLASVGYMDLLTYLGSAPGISVAGSTSRALAPGDMAVYTMTLKTDLLSVGPFQQIIPVRTSDPSNPTQNITVRGNVTPAPPDSSGGATLLPMDWTVNVTGTHTAGEWITYSHTLGGPDLQSLQPVKVFSEDYSKLWGVGKYATGFGVGTASYDMFGNGSDGALTISSNTTDSPIDSACSGTAGSSSLAATNALFAPGQLILIHQTQGLNAGQWERNAIESYSGGTITLGVPLAGTYTSGAQCLVLKQYSDVTVNSGATWSAKPWNGTVGGILAFLASGTVTLTGTISAAGKGSRGGTGRTGDSLADQGESPLGIGTASQHSNGSGGGGAWSYHPYPPGGAAGGGGGGHATAGSNGHDNGFADGKGLGGDGNFGAAELTTAVFGGAGGGGSAGDRESTTDGGSGGGFIFVAGTTITVTGSIVSNGSDTSGSSVWSTGGAGAGGSILLKSQTATLGSNLITATGGSAGSAQNSGNPSASAGGNGGLGRIRVEGHTITGSTIPVASTKILDFYSVEQVEASPYNQARLNLPESFTNGRTYKVQYGRRLVFSADGDQPTSIRLPKKIYTSASLDALVSSIGAPSGSLNLWLDIGDNGSVDWSFNGTTGSPTQLPVTTTVAALNSFLVGRSDVAWNAEVNVPIRVHMDRAGEILLTNLTLTPVGAETRFLRLPVRPNGDVRLGLQFTQPSVISGTLSFTVDVGADGSIDWSDANTRSFPVTLTSPNLATAVNAYLAGRSGDVDVPIRIVASPSMPVSLFDFSATPATRPDIAVTVSDIGFGSSSPTEGEMVSVTATLRNPSAVDSGPLSVSFFATAPGQTVSSYIGSTFVGNVPAAAASPTGIVWNTLGFTGTVPVRVVADPYKRLPESTEDNNQATSSLSVRSRPDLRIFSMQLSDAEPVSGEAVTVTLTLRNDGQTAAGPSVLAFYDGNPNSGGTLVGQSTPTVSGQNETLVSFPWHPGTTGEHRLFAVIDRDSAVGESNEGNNQNWQNVYVGVPGPILLDSGGTNDPAYTSGSRRI